MSTTAPPPSRLITTHLFCKINSPSPLALFLFSFCCKMCVCAGTAKVTPASHERENVSKGNKENKCMEIRENRGTWSAHRRRLCTVTAVAKHIGSRFGRETGFIHHTGRQKGRSQHTQQLQAGDGIEPPPVIPTCGWVGGRQEGGVCGGVGQCWQVASSEVGQVEGR